MTEAIAKKRTIGEMSTDARILINYLEGHLKGTGTFVSYGELNAAIGGRDVQGEARGILSTARRHFEREHAAILECVMSEGVKRTDEPIGIGVSQRRHIRQGAKRAVGRMVNAANGSEMLNDDKILFHTELSLLGAIVQFTTSKAEKLIAGKLKTNGSHEIPTKETLRLFAEKT